MVYYNSNLIVSDRIKYLGILEYINLVVKFNRKNIIIELKLIKLKCCEISFIILNNFSFLFIEGDNKRKNVPLETIIEGRDPLGK